MTADAVVVLGAALAAPGVPGRVLRRRVHSAVDVVNTIGAPFLVLSGGLTLHPPAEAEVMCDLAVEAGVDADRIVIEDQARNTFENAVYTGRIMRERGWSRVVVVTDAFHMRRALYVFRTLGLAAEAAPVVPAAPRTPHGRGTVATPARLWRWRRAGISSASAPTNPLSRRSGVGNVL